VKRCAWVMLLFAMAVAVGACHGILGGKSGGAAKPPPKGPVADNTRCFVCHMDYEEEELALTHARANVGCVKCHGMSDDHSDDEEHLTAPDVMYPKDKLNPACMECHPRDKIADAKSHKVVLAKILAAKMLCTDCHGKHRLARRIRRWDRATGKLLEIK